MAIEIKHALAAMGNPPCVGYVPMNIHIFLWGNFIITMFDDQRVPYGVVVVIWSFVVILQLFDILVYPSPK